MALGAFVSTVASFHYTLTNDAGQVIDSSTDRAPLTYLHGAGNIVPGLEREMAGRKAGDVFTVDGNHPLAGQTLHFAIEVADVRDASLEELGHGHVHGEGGHHH